MSDVRRSRGQAVLETVIVMPLILLGFFGVIWAMKDASLAERAQLAVRYGGMVDSLSQPYEAYSLYAMYATIDNVVPAANAACYSGDTTQLAAGYAPFWLPAASSALVTPCASSLAVVTGPETYSQPVLLRNDYSSLLATTAVSGYLSSVAFHGATTTTVRAAENFFRSPDVGILLTCTTLGSVVKNSLEGRNDTKVPTSLTSAMPTTLTTSAVVPGTITPACVPSTSSFTPAPAAPY
jgi:hypothetical protein